MLLLVYALVEGARRRAGAQRARSAVLAGACVLLAAFVVNELRSRNPLLPLSIFRVKGLAAADTTQLMAFAGLLLYVLLPHPLHAERARLLADPGGRRPTCPLTFGVIVSAGVSSQLVPRIGTRPVIVGGRAARAGGLYWLSRIPVDGSLRRRPAAGHLVDSLGLGAVFVAVISAANAGVHADKAGLAAALLNASQQVGGALGLAIFTAIATSTHQRPAREPHRHARGADLGLLAGAARVEPLPGRGLVLALRMTNTRGEARGPSRHDPASALPQAAPGREVMNPTASDVVEEISAWAIGGGVLTAALFPFALPILC